MHGLSQCPCHSIVLDSQTGEQSRHRSGAARAEAPLRQVATPRNSLRGRFVAQPVLSNRGIPLGVQEDRTECRAPARVHPEYGQLLHHARAATPVSPRVNVPLLPQSDSIAQLRGNSGHPCCARKTNNHDQSEYRHRLRPDHRQ